MSKHLVTSLLSIGGFVIGALTVCLVRFLNAWIDHHFEAHREDDPSAQEREGEQS